ncbi:MAG: hypothetical protein LCI00_14290 [Chloroflexi bacterium]|nr:hypothetical protein [Chloroflexota bacterium]MCC6895083.1 hypothetical protein [Anaerolineae bacterium]
MKEKWDKFRKEVQSKLQPILDEAGYSFQRGSPTEDKDGFVMWYEKDSTHRLTVDVIEQTVYEAGIRKDFNWIRVDIAGRLLKQFVDVNLDSNVYLQQGWIWLTDEELVKCIEEISRELHKYFESHPE